MKWFGGFVCGMVEAVFSAVRNCDCGFRYNIFNAYTKVMYLFSIKLFCLYVGHNANIKVDVQTNNQNISFIVIHL